MATLALLDLTKESTNPLAKFDEVADFVNLIIPVLFGGAAIVFFVMMLRGAFTFMTAAGDTDKVKQAQKMFKFAIFGIVIVIVSYLAIKVLEGILGIKIFI